jgi:mono/diheme cytochrome c family protein
MPDHRHFVFRFAWLALVVLALGACRPQSGLPQGPTPIPTLIPVSGIDTPEPSTPEVSFTTLSYPAQIPSAARGYQIYRLQCEECHGPRGTGAVPGARDFSDTDFMRGETPAAFYAVVTEGRGEMPAYAEILSSDERWDAVFFVWRLSTTHEALEQGEEIYARQCSPCHGEDGTGELLGSADFTNLREMDSLAPRDLYLTVTQGRGSMPAWQSLLDQGERWAVINYVRTFTYDPALPSGLDLEAGGTAAGTETTAAACAKSGNPFEWQDAEAIQAGEDLFADQCAACHGDDGAGGLPNTPDFTSSVMRAELETETGELFCVLTDGVGAMPGFERTLSEEQRWQLLTFLHSLSG